MKETLYRKNQNCFQIKKKPSNIMSPHHRSPDITELICGVMLNIWYTNIRCQILRQ